MLQIDQGFPLNRLGLLWPAQSKNTFAQHTTIARTRFTLHTACPKDKIPKQDQSRLTPSSVPTLQCPWHSAQYSYNSPKHGNGMDTMKSDVTMHQIRGGMGEIWFQSPKGNSQNIPTKIR